jgi:L-threonylcarbamoyladenylate synthase
VSEADAAPGYARFDCTGTDPGALEEAMEAAREAVERGECIVLPTDTVYGIGADAFSVLAVTRLLNAKDRGRDMPPPVLIADASLLRALAVDVPEPAWDLVARHWPGPLTMIFRAQPSLRMDLGDTDGTIALRVPDHGLARDILRRTGPMAVSSANLSGRPAATSCDQAIEQLGESVTVYLDGGPLPGSGAPSTILDFTRNPSGSLLRPGALSVEVLRETCADLNDPTAAPAPEPEPAAIGPYPTTDELGITHTPVDPDQPTLFESGESGA